MNLKGKKEARDLKKKLGEINNKSDYSVNEDLSDLFNVELTIISINEELHNENINKEIETLKNIVYRNSNRISLIEDRKEHFNLRSSYRLEIISLILSIIFGLSTIIITLFTKIII